MTETKYCNAPHGQPCDDAIYDEPSGCDLCISRKHCEYASAKRPIEKMTPIEIANRVIESCKLSGFDVYDYVAYEEDGYGVVGIEVASEDVDRAIINCSVCGLDGCEHIEIPDDDSRQKVYGYVKRSNTSK